MVHSNRIPANIFDTLDQQKKRTISNTMKVRTFKMLYSNKDDHL